jgi:hypothetical protein
MARRFYCIQQNIKPVGAGEKMGADKMELATIEANAEEAKTMEARASYNITNDKLKAYFPERLKEADYKAARSAGFVFWHGSKCFVAKWSTQAEDFLRNMGIEEIEEDDSADDVEARVDRFQGYAESATSAADSSERYLEERANTKRRRENALNSISRNLSVATHWQSRIDGAIRHAARKERVDVIGRRILGLEADLRKMQRTLDESQNKRGAWIDCPENDFAGAKALANYDGGISRCFPLADFPRLRADASTYEGQMSIWSALDGGIIDSVRARAIAITAHEKCAAWAQRWVSHIENRIAYERACYDAAGGTESELHPPRKKAVQPKGKAVAKDGSAIEVGGAIEVRNYLGSGSYWELVTKVNRNTVEVVYLERLHSSETRRPRMIIGKKESFLIVSAKSAETVKADGGEVLELWERYSAAAEKAKEAKKAAKAAK